MFTFYRVERYFIKQTSDWCVLCSFSRRRFIGFLNKTTLLLFIQQTEKRLLLEIKQLKVDIGGRVGTLEKYKWLILGGAIVIGWILSSNFKMIIEMMS